MPPHSTATSRWQDLVAHGADAALASDDGKTPLDVAVEKGHEAVAGWLRSLGTGTTSPA